MDHLLLWLSAKGAGSWSQFRAAVEELHVQSQTISLDDPDAGDRSGSDLPIYHEARLALQRLGHVEFHAPEHSWRVVPPCMAFLADGSGRALLCGGRSGRLLERLNDVAVVEALPVDGMPRRILLGGASEIDLAGHARVLGLPIQEAAPVAILCATPNARDRTTWLQQSMPEMPGWIVHRFSPAHLEWTSAAQEEAARSRTGLFRFAMKHQRIYYLRWRGCSYKVPVQVGKYAVMRKRHGTLSYEPTRWVLALPAICRPPLLIERALILCSGVLPRFQPSTSRLEYGEVPRSVAQLAAQLLHQEMR